MKNRVKISMLLVFAGLLSCTREEPLVNIGLDDSYRIERMKALHLKPELSGDAYRWTIENGVGEDSLLSEERNLIFLAEKPGNYSVTCEIIDDANPLKHTLKILVTEELIAYSPFISKVFEYHPAPGQFVNKAPVYESGNTEKDMVRKAEEAIAENNQRIVSLGSFGGYITFGFDHTVINVPGKYDFKISGNAFAELNPDGSVKPGGSSEPGIVMVSFDTNNNGIPDDEWYELAGSEYHKPETIKNYEITYHKPDSDKSPVAGTGSQSFITDITYIPWEDNQGDEGFVHKNSFHQQSYWPLWLNGSPTLTFGGTRLKSNAIDMSEEQNGSLIIEHFYPWGYADNMPDNMDNGFKIDWAVDAEGNPAKLQGIDFVRVYTGINHYNGWKGEASTEISGARDLHVEKR